MDYITPCPCCDNEELVYWEHEGCPYKSKKERIERDGQVYCYGCGKRIGTALNINYNCGNHVGMKPKLDKLIIALTEMKRNSYEFSIDFLPELIDNIKKL